MTVSLIITTYNWPRALYQCLDSVMQQTVMPSEILIADDGSGISTRDVVRHFQNISPVPVHHIWHEDRGFRVAAIRNKAIAASSGDYVIHVDGDLILQRNFIQTISFFAREGCYVSGSRGIVTEMLTQKASLQRRDFTSLSALTKGVRNSNNAMRILRLISILYRARSHPGHREAATWGVGAGTWSASTDSTKDSRAGDMKTWNWGCV